jgi:hypothetical protein
MIYPKLLLQLFPVVRDERQYAKPCYNRVEPALSYTHTSAVHYGTRQMKP